MKILLAKSAGFCFGVNNAIDHIVKLLDQGKRVYTLGPIIHNPQMTQQLAQRGVQVVESPEDIPQEEDVVAVIRSHGVPPDIYHRLAARQLTVCDATCPFVAKIHRIVANPPAEAAAVLIAGDPNHPEVVGIRGHSALPAYVFRTEAELDEIYKNNPDLFTKNVVVVAQTTFHTGAWEKCVKKIKKYCTNPVIFDTICNATAERQAEAVALAKNSDLMVIVGGRHSSNTAKLRDVCAPYCKTILIETAEELDKSLFCGVRTVGLTAGASTPADIIKEVVHTMTDILQNENDMQETPAEGTSPAVEPVAPEQGTAAAPAEAAVSDEQAAPAEQEKSLDDMSFEEALEASLQQWSTDDERVRGIVVGISPSEVQVEVIGRKQTGYIPLEELTADPNAKPEDIVSIGDELELLVMRTNDLEGTVMLSKRRVDAQKGWEKIVEAHATGEVLEGVVTDVVKGGVLAVTHNVRVFIPASQASVQRMEDLSPLLKKRVKFRIIEVNNNRRRAVASIRSVAREERKRQEEAFWAQAEVGQTYTGKVKSLTSYGAFVDLGGVDGMIHISELSWTRIKHPSEVVKVGDVVQVYIRDLDREKKRISLGYRKAEDNPWEIFKAKYPVGSVVNAKIVGMTTFGAFAEIFPGVDGLIHISQIADRRIDKPQDVLKIGQQVTAKITNIDYDNKRISLSIRALLEPQNADDPDAVKAATEETPAAEVPVEADAAETPAETPAPVEQPAPAEQAAAEEAAADESATEAPAEPAEAPEAGEAEAEAAEE